MAETESPKVLENTVGNRDSGHNDGDHMQRFYKTLDDVCVDDEITMSIVKTAQVVARLYRLQLEELTHDLD